LPTSLIRLLAVDRRRRADDVVVGLKGGYGSCSANEIEGEYDESVFAQFATFFFSRDFVLLGASNGCFRAMVLEVASRGSLLLLPGSGRSLLCDRPIWGLGIYCTKSNDLLTFVWKQRDRN
jgi:hypothetical protein